ncbi:translation initiation factor IF-3 [Candidatus Avelusimicrobium facis]|uniref:translation initiation factor IF-3 n=1 Tax=Candidatus Avelusimicrobium facis TaxID=3416203 RepID=UPI0015B3D753
MARYDNRRVFKKDLYTRNGNIRAQEVRVIDSDGSMIGIQPLSVAIAMAKEQELDLVEISPNAQPPVCKILDYNKYVFEQSKKNKDAKKKQSKVTMKELRIKSRIAPHDLDVKLRQIEGFLKKKDMVRLVVVFHGRENQHKDIGMQMLQDAAKRLEPLANVDGGLQQQGNRMSMTFVPKA